MKLNPRNSATPWEPQWPENPKHKSNPLFEPRSALRKMVVVVDAYLLTDDNAVWDQMSVLSSLLRHELIDLYKFSEDGPPPTADRIKGRLSGDDIALGWITLEPDPDFPNKIKGICYSHNNKVIQDGILGNSTELAKQDDAATSYRELGLEEARRCREQDFISAQAADAAKADLFITQRPYLYESQYKHVFSTTFCDIPDALSLVGLYLRTQGKFLINGPPGQFSFNLGLYYWVGARELLPEAWRWFTACEQHEHSLDDKKLTYLGISLIQRVERALWARDDLHRANNREQDKDTGAQAAEAFDRLLLYLIGAVDISARVAHRVLGFDTSERDAGWQRDGWLKKVTASNAALAALFETTSEHRQTLIILSKLRNSVHGVALQNMSFRKNFNPTRNLINLSISDEAAVLESIGCLGGHAIWGVEEIAKDLVLVDRAMFIEELFPRVLNLLNNVMKLTPVENLSGVNITAADCSPPLGDPMDTFSEEVRLSIRWQLGLHNRF